MEITENSFKGNKNIKNNKKIKQEQELISYLINYCIHSAFF